MNRFYTPAPAGYGKAMPTACSCGRTGGCGNGIGGCGNGTTMADPQTADNARAQNAAAFETVTTGPARDALLEMLPLAMAYVPLQRWGAVYSPEEALMHGTLFPELDLPFEGRRRSWK